MNGVTGFVCCDITRYIFGMKSKQYVIYIKQVENVLFPISSKSLKKCITENLVYCHDTAKPAYVVTSIKQSLVLI